MRLMQVHTEQRAIRPSVKGRLAKADRPQLVLLVIAKDTLGKAVAVALAYIW